MSEDLDAEVVDDVNVEQPPQSDPFTDPPPRHDPFAHGIGGPGPGAYRPPPADNGASFKPPPPRPGPEPRKLRGDERRLHDKLTSTYATVGLVVCAAAETRMQIIGPPDPIGARDPERERARRATALMNNAGVTTVNLSSAAADAWLEVAKEVPAVKVALDRFMEGGAIMGLVAIHAMMLIPYGVAAGWVPEIIGERLASVGAAMGAAASPNGN